MRENSIRYERDRLAGLLAKKGGITETGGKGPLGDGLRNLVGGVINARGSYYRERGRKLGRKKRPEEASKGIQRIRPLIFY